jgi:hypothetical protein
MYKVFVNDKPLFLTNHISKETDFQLFLLESIDIEQLIVKIFQNKINKAYLYHPDESLILKTLKAKIPVTKAGGGLVYNRRNGKYKLKITHWFEMQSDFEGIPQGQLEEGIEKVAWMNPEQIKEALKNSYENIKLLFEEEYKL